MKQSFKCGLTSKYFSGRNLTLRLNSFFGTNPGKISRLRQKVAQDQTLQTTSIWHRPCDSDPEAAPRTGETEAPGALCAGLYGKAVAVCGRKGQIATRDELASGLSRQDFSWSSTTAWGGDSRLLQQCSFDWIIGEIAMLRQSVLRLKMSE
jgi:hypothetical protein